MASPTVAVEVKISDELKALCDRLPENLPSRLAEIERVLVEICDRNGIAFNVEPVDRTRVLRNVKYHDGSDDK